MGALREELELEVEVEEDEDQTAQNDSKSDWFSKVLIA